MGKLLNFFRTSLNTSERDLGKTGRLKSSVTEKQLLLSLQEYTLIREGSFNETNVRCELLMQYTYSQRLR